MLRCAGCGGLVSEFAARCPACRRSTDDAERPPPEPEAASGDPGEVAEPETVEVEPAPTPANHRFAVGRPVGHGRWVMVAAAAAVIVAGTVLGVRAISGPSSRHHGVPAASTNTTLVSGETGAAVAPSSAPTDAVPSLTPGAFPLTSNVGGSTGNVLTVLGSVGLGSQAPTFGSGGSQLILAGADVYAFQVSRGGGITEVDRVDVAHMAVASGTQLAGCSAGASISTGVLAVLSDPTCRATGATVLQLLDPVTLRVRASSTVAPAGGVLARPEGIYVSQRGRIGVYSAANLAPDGGFAVDVSGTADQPGGPIAADPRSEILWVSVPCSCPSMPVVDIVSLATGHVIGRFSVPAVTEANPQGMGDDAWVIFATGTMSAAERFSPSGQALTPTIQTGVNSANMQVTGLHLWVGETTTPLLHLSCRSLSTGAPQGQVVIQTPGLGPPLFFLGADNSHVYLGVGDRLLVYRPVGPCA